MIPDFEDHHFVKDAKPNEAPSRHHCERCGMKAVLGPDGSIDFLDASEALVGISANTGCRVDRGSATEIGVAPEGFLIQGAILNL
jgi:hypothetical protein